MPGKSKEYSTELSGSIDVCGGIDGSQVNGPDLPLFSFNFVATSTDNFSEENKLGEGGFGPVYKVRDTINFLSKKFGKVALNCAKKKKF